MKRSIRALALALCTCLVGSFAASAANTGASTATASSAVAAASKSATTLTRTALNNATVSTNMRGVWVSTVYNLDYPSSATTNVSTLKQQADTICANAQSMGMNTVFLQVRSSSDALYKSAYFPWSKYLTGKQGTAPADNFDPLTYWIQTAHEHGLQLHAWINPYRITTGGATEWNSLVSYNPAKEHSSWVVKYNNNYYYNPGLPEVRKLVVDGVKEIVKNYDVDGIHFDDYFYPGTNFNDGATYASDNEDGLSLANWRRNNVNLLVRQSYEAIKSLDSNCMFGISPAGVWENKSSDSRGSDTKGGNPSYSTHYADSLAWIKNKWIDYICPQIYWEIGNSAANFTTLTQWWSNAVASSDVKLYIGLAAYKCGDDWTGYSRIIDELVYMEDCPQVDGEIYFNYSALRRVSGFASAVGSYYANHPVTIIDPTPPAPTPPEPTPPEPTPPAPTPLTADDVEEQVSYMQIMTLMFSSIVR